ncbi:hypothetical protein [Pontibacter russatus]|uniref:hypothetical protein n=1 Tax=Pontibacter russatus TaxID=2694929 RepID=UPI00137B3CCE|nr:hypothetical protein [Pontibacter russatus]
MKFTCIKGLLLAGAVISLVSCAGSRRQPSRTGKVIVIEDTRHARTASGHKDNGLHKGWYKNPNNPHHPNTTNPGHTKAKKGKGAKGGNAKKGKKK